MTKIDWEKTRKKKLAIKRLHEDNYEKSDNKILKNNQETEINRKAIYNNAPSSNKRTLTQSERKIIERLRTFLKNQTEEHNSKKKKKKKKKKKISTIK